MSEEVAPAQPGSPYRIIIGAPIIRAFLDAQSRLGSAYGPQDELTIAEDTLGGHQIEVSLRHDQTGWMLTVRASPALRAWVNFTAAQRSWRQPFDAQGKAAFPALEEAWLRTGFDLVLELDFHSS